MSIGLRCTTQTQQSFRTEKDVRARIVEASLSSLNDFTRGITIYSMQTRQFLATVAVPNLRGILSEEDRILQAASVILNAFVLPTLRSRLR